MERARHQPVTPQRTPPKSPDRKRVQTVGGADRVAQRSTLGIELDEIGPADA